jgi:hypothetical protein
MSASIPNEILAMIFEDLDIVSSICLGLTCRNFWQFHKTRFSYPNCISLWRSGSIYDERNSPGIALHELLKDWMGDKKLYAMPGIYPKRLIFMTPKLHEEKLRRYFKY